MNESDIINKIQRIRSMLNDLENSITGINKTELAMISNDFNDMKQLVMSDDWPKAVEEDMICDERNEIDKINRAKGMLEVMVGESIEAKKILDFGTGEGHIIKEAVNKGAAYAMGYDIENNFIKKSQRMEFTTEWKSVLNHAPYDTILCCDVLDHLVDLDPVDALKKMKSVLNQDGKIYLRRHNYMSRHGTHLYKQLNKAFLHVVFNFAELVELIPNIVTIPTSKVYFPIKTYIDQITSSGLQLEMEYKTISPVEDIFERREIVERIFKNTPFKHFPRQQMELDFVDYVLRS